MADDRKYHSESKAREYAAMSWPQFGENELSEPFYLRISELIQRVAGSLEAPSPVCIEFGFGAGRHLFELRKWVSGARIVGIEASPSMLQMARAVLAERCGEHGIALLTGDMQSCCLEDGAVDLALTVNVLDRVPDTRGALRELSRIVAPKGFLICASAFDYESYTPSVQRLTPEQMKEALVSLGHRILEEERTVLKKRVAGSVVTFREEIFVASKR